MAKFQKPSIQLTVIRVALLDVDLHFCHLSIAEQHERLVS